MTRRPTSPPATAGGFVRGMPQGRHLARRSLLWGAVLVVVAFALLAQLGENGVVSWWRLRQERQELQAEVERLEAANAMLENRLQAVAEDPEALERLAREEQGMLRPGEEAVTVIRDPEDIDQGRQ
ncbi:MAG: septum formation initiator family protein [bacterium]|nr:septum formation initiator family protein [bacterium]